MEFAWRNCSLQKNSREVHMENAFDMTILALENVSYVNGGRRILHDISFTVEKGDFLTINGSSGSGKSTLLRLCASLISPSDGKITYNGIDMNSYDAAKLRKSIAYCAQSSCLFGSTVMDNLAFPFMIRNEEYNKERVNGLLSMFGLPGSILDADIKSLSGGEKQRIAMIRALIFIPEVLLLDEVSSALDTENSLAAENVVHDLNKKGVTVLWITHDPAQSHRYANRLMTLEAGRIKSMEVLR